MVATPNMFHIRTHRLKTKFIDVPDKVELIVLIQSLIMLPYFYLNQEINIVLQKLCILN